MYHIKDDKRCKTSADLIVESIYRLLKIKKFEYITISDIQKESGVSRATFYRLFDNLSDVLMYECNNVFSNMIKQFNRRTSNKSSAFDMMFTYFFTYWTTHGELLDVLVESNKIDILTSCFQEHAHELGSLMTPNNDLSEKEIYYFVSTATGALLGIFSGWIKSGRKESASELMVILKECFKTVNLSLQ